ncbi:MAG: site-specific integrase [Methanobacteriota archaeon]
MLANKNPVIEMLEYHVNPSTRSTVDWLNLEKGEDFAVWEAAREIREKALIHSELYLGMRRISVQRFQLSWFNGQSINIHGKGRGGGKWRTIAPHKDTAELFATVKEHNSQLAKKAGSDSYPDNMMLCVKGTNLRKYGFTSLDNIVKRVSVRSGIEFSHHTLRRTAGRRMWKAGIAIESIARFLGHSDIRMTMLYIGANYDDTEAAMRAAEKWDEERKRSANGTGGP